MKINLATIFTLQLSTVAMASIVKNLVVFGDSNSDVGTIQRWSNGPLWSEYVAAAWNASLYSFAFSGAVCDSGIYKSIAKDDKVPSLRDQLEAYYNLDLKLKPEETVYAFWFGVQDIFEMAKRHGRQEPDYKEVIDCIGQQLRIARKVFLSDRFLVLNVPPLGSMPFYQNTELAVNRSQAAVEVNRGLEKDVANLNKHHHALEMDYVDIYSLINDIIVDPTIFNFKNPNTSYLDECFEEKSCIHSEDDYIWWDETHFTTAFHKSIAISIIDAESYLPKVLLTEDLIQQINNPKSKFHSEMYTAPSYKGNVDKAAALYDIQKSQPHQPQQPPLEEDILDFTSDHTQQSVAAFYPSKGHVFIGLFILILLIGVFIIWNKFSSLNPYTWLQNRIDRSKFIPVRNEEV
ncbi:MAG: GDSL-like Lipase/Acylhydrolase-domain-containing protein [Benjaminiella poitrasii]|nr:MAG: GDSL-like Lipase/Acylhydrolase-domain-containing protein [Benjaminiella poitrasii]